MFQNRCPSLEGNNCNKRANNRVAGKLKGISFAETYKTEGENQVSSVVFFFKLHRSCHDKCVAGEFVQF